jgi:hypothetical protein
MLLSLLARKKVTKEMHPGKPPFGYALSFGKIRPRLNSLHYATLKQNPLFSLIFPALLRRLQGDFKDMVISQKVK